MAKKKVKTKKKVQESSNNCWYCSKMTCNDKSGCIYVLGFIGALIYYLSTATGFWNGVLGVLKAIIWPLFIVMKILGL